MSHAPDCRRPYQFQLDQQVQVTDQSERRKGDGSGIGISIGTPFSFVGLTHLTVLGE